MPSPMKRLSPRLVRSTGAVIAVAALAVTARSACARVGGASELSTQPVVVVPDDSSSLRRLLGTVRGVDPFLCELATRSVDMHGRWSHWGPFSNNPLERDSAAARLVDWIQDEHNDPALVPMLRTALRDTDACVRRIAGSFLGRIAHPSAVDALLAGLDDAEAHTRAVAAIGLGIAEASRSVGPLMRRLKDDDAEVRRASAWALGAIEDREALPALYEMVEKDRDARVRQAAAWAIGEILG